MNKDENFWTNLIKELLADAICVFIGLCLWNTIMPDLFNVPTLTYLQAYGLHFMIRFLK